MRFIALDSLRGIAALLVALVHFSVAWTLYDLPFIRNGGIAVPLFFVLSGFVIAHAYEARLVEGYPSFKFLIRRFGRLYPLHIFTLALLVGLELMKLVLVGLGVPSGVPPFEGANSLSSLIASVFLLQAVIPFQDFTWNIPSWSISTEFYTYVIFAVLVTAFMARIRWVTLVVVLGTLAGLFYMDLNGIHVPKPAGRGMLECVCGFFLGNLTYHVVTRVRASLWRPSLVSELGAGALFFLAFWFGPPASISLPIFAIIIFIFAFEGSVVSRALAVGPLQFLGRVSYSIYLVHFVLLSVLSGVVRAAQSALHTPLYVLYGNDYLIDFGPRGSMDVLALAYLGVVVALATLTYNYIEEPSREYFNRLSQRLPSRPVRAPQVLGRET